MNQELHKLIVDAKLKGFLLNNDEGKGGSHGTKSRNQAGYFNQESG